MSLWVSRSDWMLGPRLALGRALPPLHMSPPRWKMSERETSVPVRQGDGRFPLFTQEKVMKAKIGEGEKGVSRSHNPDILLIINFCVKCFKPYFPQNFHRAFVPDLLAESALLAKVNLTWYFSGASVPQQLTYSWNEPPEFHTIQGSFFFESNSSFFWWGSLKTFRQTWVL